MEQYIVTGMSCAACSSRVEKAVSKVDGVTSCSVSLLTNFWVIKENSTLYAEEAMQHQDRAFQLTEIQNDPDQKEYKNQCSFRFPETITTDYDGDPFIPGEGYRLVVKALGKDDMIVDSPTIESGVFTIYDPNAPEEEE